MEVGFLSPLFDRPGPWASVYLDTTALSPDPHPRAERAAHAACARLRGQGADPRTCRAVYEAMTTPAEPPAPPGRAIFATDGTVVLAPPLATAPDGGPHACWEALPHTGPLLELAETNPACVVARVRPDGATFELHGPYGVLDAGRVRGDWPVHRSSPADWSVCHFRPTEPDDDTRGAELVADGIRNCAARTRPELVILAGDRAVRMAVLERLPAGLRSRTVHADERTGTADGPPQVAGERGGTTDPIAPEVARIRATHGRRHARSTMECFLSGRLPTDDGRIAAAEGVPALIDAARQHRIGSLIVRPEGVDLHREVWVGQDPEQLAVRPTDAQLLGGQQPATARADDALVRSAATSGAEVLCVRPYELAPGTPDGLPSGGLGALLRWPYGAAPETTHRREGGGRDGGHAARQ
ncbi:hypothetical protein [Streptomyces oceani]|uniref:Peptide chain release factor 1 n=1 Tax=Streptomyces oceani TaxID=1075402 RepID=A0A1E7KJQ1_9ACTN|nr:hypothetical protein [Streptomyces oceani]OEV04188.1 hypothetical protein AN216_08245 [Streptomyces oceani]